MNMVHRYFFPPRVFQKKDPPPPRPAGFRHLLHRKHLVPERAAPDSGHEGWEPGRDTMECGLQIFRLDLFRQSDAEPEQVEFAETENRQMNDAGIVQGIGLFAV